jgi:catechol 2,3-dioxygenase-like lactoylglutathione lyase family enzyme
MTHLHLVALVVHDYDPAIRFFVDVLGFDLVDDSPSLTNDGRVGFFLRVDDFDAYYNRMTAAGVEFVRPPRTEPYGQVAVFRDIAGNRWDLVG